MKKKSKLDQSGDRWIHDVVSTGLIGDKNKRRDAVIDSGVKEHGAQHRNFYPHRTIAEACAHMCIQDVVQGRKPDIAMNLKATCGHFLVDSLPTRAKETLRLFQLLRG